MPEAEVMAPSINAGFNFVHTLFLGFSQNSSPLRLPIGQIRWLAALVGFQELLLLRLLRRETGLHPKAPGQEQHFHIQELQNCC